MSGQIRMTPAQMRGRAGEVRVQGEAVQEFIGKMQNIINELQTEWEGQSSREFASQFERLKPAFNDMRNLVDDMGTQLDRTADAVEQMDSDIAGKFRG